VELRSACPDSADRYALTVVGKSEQRRNERRSYLLTRSSPVRNGPLK
jgi:hypothetical protein